MRRQCLTDLEKTPEKIEALAEHEAQQTLAKTKR
jgi:hypothetical protein